MIGNDLVPSSLTNSPDMEFCDDLLVEIFSRLPFESLARFKCVSRSWRALISGGYLRRRLPLLAAGLFVHVPRDGDSAGGGGEPRYATACAGGGGLEFCDMSFFPLVETARVVDACEGLLLYRSVESASELFVASPATRRWAALPVPRREAQLPLLAFDPASGSPPHYHVVCFVAWQERGATVDVFSSASGAWAERDAAFGVDASSLSPTTHYRGGVLHVLAYPDRVVLMDLATAMAPCRLAPRLPEDIDAGARLGHSRGLLHYAKCDGERLRVWALDSSSSSPGSSCQWILTNTVRVNDVIINGGRWPVTEVKFLAFHPDIADVVYLSSPAGEVASCDLRKKEIVSSWKLGAEHHIVRFWLLSFSSGLMNCLGVASNL
ncbi:putative F-box/kelch-repeat protein At1g15680 [Oryza brachyantha]|uniref:putative F-box/kelch-repeat protein At1g15680 n=1 Tax=Oryza brachyantha TaxID=4533 RepID=UPI001AD960E5|nr:putative F-box/kelch-repeat protein At1g15680 [Oryza brachyantha]